MGEAVKDSLLTGFMTIAGLSGMSLGIQAALPFAQELGWFSLCIVYLVIFAWVAFWAAFCVQVISSYRWLRDRIRLLRDRKATEPVFPTGRVVKMRRPWRGR